MKSILVDVYLSTTKKSDGYRLLFKRCSEIGEDLGGLRAQHELLGSPMMFVDEGTVNGVIYYQYKTEVNDVVVTQEDDAGALFRFSVMCVDGGAVEFRQTSARSYGLTECSNDRVLMHHEYRDHNYWGNQLFTFRFANPLVVVDNV